MKTYIIALFAALSVSALTRADTVLQILPALAAAHAALEESDESRATLAGTDRDGDGIRDDVAARIDLAYPADDYLNEQTRTMARGFQQLVAGSLSAMQAQAQLVQIERAQDCIVTRGADPSGGAAFLLPHQLNTYQRSKAYLEAARTAQSSLGNHEFRPCD